MYENMYVLFAPVYYGLIQQIMKCGCSITSFNDAQNNVPIYNLYKYLVVILIYVIVRKIPNLFSTWYQNWRKPYQYWDNYIKLLIWTDNCIAGKLIVCDNFKDCFAWFRNNQYEIITSMYIMLVGNIGIFNVRVYFVS